ncbi:MAG TPA: hypothetical protein VH913_21825 [Hyphomicrobiaceae bacterium]|jgi:hypothetical protein
MKSRARFIAPWNTLPRKQKLEPFSSFRCVARPITTRPVLALVAPFTATRCALKDPHAFVKVA